jgi:uroporphyrinogen-III synthase
MTPLNKLRVLNTRPEGAAVSLNQAIEAADGIAMTLPGLQIKAHESDWLSPILPLTQAEQAIFISPNAATYCFERLRRCQIAWPATVRVSAIGNATASTLKKVGVYVDYVPDIATSEHLVQLNNFQDIQHQTIFLFKGGNGREIITDTLLEKGANLISVSVYGTEKPTITPGYINFLWKNDAIDTILFTSLQAMQNIITFFTGESLVWLCNKPCIVISERLANEAKQLGMKRIIISHYNDIINTLIQIKKGLLHDSESRCCKK